MATWKWYVGVLALGLVLIGICSIGMAQSSDSINFGSVPVGQTGTATYTFKILETSETAATVTILPPSSPFALQDAPSGSFTLAPGQSITFSVTFTPTAAGDYTGSFTITAQGGYPVQEKTTTVYLTGHGGSGGEAPPPGETPSTPGITIPFPLIPPTTEIPAGAVPGTTDDEGKFKVALSPTTTVAGQLSRCEDGKPLADKPFQLAKTAEGFSLFASGYEEKPVTKFSKFSIMGLESYDLGDVCLTPGEEEPGVCPCCSIIIEARMCCSPDGEYVETDTVYQPQRVRIRVAYCEPTKEFGDADLTTAPLTNTGGVLWDPGLMPNALLISDETKIGATSVTLDDKSLYTGTGQLTKTLYASSLAPGSHTVRATIGRFNGHVCVCEKTFQVLPCPSVNTQIKETIEPKSGCSPVRVTYDLEWPGENDGICDISYWDLGNPFAPTQRASSFPMNLTYSNSYPCTRLRIEPEFTVTTKNCCRYSIDGSPIRVSYPFGMKTDCICLRLVPNSDGKIATQVVFRPTETASGGQPCVMCDNYKVTIDWGDGTTSDEEDLVYDADAGEATVTHQYETDPKYEDQRPPVDAQVKVEGPCGSVQKTLTGRCRLPGDLIPNDILDTFLDIAQHITNPLEAALVVDSLFSVFNKVGETQGKTTVCSVLLDMQLKGLDMGIYSDLQRLVEGFRSGIAGGVFEGSYDGKETPTKSWRFYPSSVQEGDTHHSTAKIVYIPGKPGQSPYFALTILRGGCDGCPVQPTYRIVSTLTDEQAKKEVKEATEGLNSSSKSSRTTFSTGTYSVSLQIGLCCPPDMCDNGAQ